MSLGFDQREAPNFGKTEYPGNGERIGPAWRAAWATLSDGAWHGRDELIEVMQRMAHFHSGAGIVEITALNILRRARRNGILKTRSNYRPDGGRAASDYRIA